MGKRQEPGRTATTPVHPEADIVLTMLAEALHGVIAQMTKPDGNVNIEAVLQGAVLLLASLVDAAAALPGNGPHAHAAIAHTVQLNLRHILRRHRPRETR